VVLSAGRCCWCSLDSLVMQVEHSLGLLSSIRLTPRHSPIRIFNGHFPTRGAEAWLQVWRTKNALHIDEENEALTAVSHRKSNEAGEEYLEKIKYEKRNIGLIRS
jgi:hypothetical protein